jgi:hypothetical protein
MPPIFDDIPWGSSDTWNRTVWRLRTSGVDFATLPEWYDVDHFTDLQRLYAELRDRKALDAPLEELLPELSRIVELAAKNRERTRFER